jgi:hypothetical protein
MFDALQPSAHPAKTNASSSPGELCAACCGFYPGFFTDDIFWPPLSDEREMHGATHSDKSESILFRRGNTLAHHVRFEASKMVNIIY